MEEDVLVESQLEYEDQDSLFGSPPPSPRGRSPSPTLALPSHGNGLNDRQNVGTIALPGSQSYSKLPMNPLAPSLSLPQASQLPAQGCSNPTAAQASTSQEPQKWTADASAGQMKSSGTYCSTRQKKKNAQSKSKESTPRPEITLPDPSVPPPANFLRNQSALLGTAGLVGGVRPSKLSTNRYTCGATPSNPIVVDDEDEPSAIGRSRYRTGMNQSIDPSRLPAPSNQDIVAMLIGQKDIFPVLESILKLIANGATSTPRLTGFERKSASERPQQNVNGTGTNPSSTDKPPPSKRRKLSRVPAGAADWDVPYPFPQGEGPEEYRQNWERERGKQLIAQLVNLIKIAARKAAMKNYLQKEENKKKHEEERKKLRELDERQRIETREATMEASSSEILLDKSNELPGFSRERSLKNSTAPASRASPAISVATSGTSTPYSFCATSLQQSGYSQLPHLPSEQQRQTQSTAAFDQLISSLLSASPAHDISSGNMQNSIASSNSAPLSRLSTSVDSSGSITPVDQTLFDSWMSVLQAFPVPSGGFQQTQEQSSIADSSISTTSFVDGDVGFDFTGMDFNMEGINNAIPDFDAMMAPLSDTSQPQPSLTPMNSDQCSININSSTGTELPSPCLLDINHLIDPTLLAISTHQPEPNKIENIPSEGPGVSMDGGATQPSLLSPSPVPSTGSTAGQNDPTTPNSATWDVCFPDIFSPTENQDNMGISNSVIGPTLVGLGEVDGMLTRNGGNIAKAPIANGKEKATISTSPMLDIQKSIPFYPATYVSADMDTTQPASANNSPLPNSVVSTSSPATHSSVPSCKQTSASSSALSFLTSSSLASSVPSQLSGPIGVRTSTKKDVLRRGKERREKLAAELARIKTKLWETTIEQGALAHIVRHYNEVANSSSANS